MFDGNGAGDLAFPFGGISGDVPVVGNWKTALVSPSGVNPSAGSGPSGTPQSFTVHYTDLYGSRDITYGQILFDNPDPNGIPCQVEWDTAGALNLLSPGGNSDGAFGQSGSLSNASCSIDMQNSRFTATASGYDVTVWVTFTDQFPMTSAG